MKKMNNFFKILFNAFDRCIIIPVTRLIYKISKVFNKPNKKFETWLSKTNTLLFLSLFLSVAIFIVVDRRSKIAHFVAIIHPFTTSTVAPYMLHIQITWALLTIVSDQKFEIAGGRTTSIIGLPSTK